MSKIPNRPKNVLPDGLVAEILNAFPAKANAPAAKRRAAIKQALISRIQAEPGDAVLTRPSQMRIVRAESGNWFIFAPNVEMKILHDDGETRTWLARFEAGGCIPAHLQSGDEEALVLEGWCYVGEHIMRKGDYQLIPKGARHGEIVSPEGCLVFVRSHSAKRSAAELAIAR